MTDGEVLATLARVRQLCDRIAANIADHSTAHGHGDEGHGVTDCVEGLSRLAPAFAALAHTGACVAVELSTDLAMAIRVVIEHLDDEEEEE